MSMKILERLQDRIMSMVGKAIIASVNDTTDLQTIKITGLADEVQDDVERLQNFGFTSNPPKKSEAIVLYIGGNRDHPVAITVDSSRERMKGLESGESAMYSSFDNHIHLKSDGSIVVSGSKIYLGGENGKALATEDILSTIGPHTHPVSGTVAGPSTDVGMISLAVDPNNKTLKTEAE